jgi:parvulin-like peptidyl-prolyl isomerase
MTDDIKDPRGPDFIESSSRSLVRVILEEPLFHFLVLGALLFVAYSFLNKDSNPTSERVVVSAGKIEHLSSLFARTWQRQPTDAEMRGLVDDFVREEVAYREGMKLGLDQDDTIIRRRIRQKIDFIADDLASKIEPTEEQLATFLKEHPEPYRVNTTVSFRQIYLDPERHAEDLDAQVANLLKTLENDPSANAAELGDSTLLEFQAEDRSLREVAGMFGETFAQRLASIAMGQWQGPIPSAYGVHVVCVDERTEGHLPPLDDVREIVRRDWEQKRREELIESFYQQLLKQYEIDIEWPETVSQGP